MLRRHELSPPSPDDQGEQAHRSQRTARRQFDPWAHTRAMITAMTEQPRDANQPQILLAPLFPDAWLASHPEAHRPWSR
jgi:hypothetical protein